MAIIIQVTTQRIVLKSTSIKNEFKNDLLSHDLPPAIPISIKKG